MTTARRRVVSRPSAPFRETPMTTPLEPMLLFIAFASSLYVIPWLLWWNFSRDEGVELRYVE
jgi:hypothetical protein